MSKLKALKTQSPPPHSDGSNGLHSLGPKGQKSEKVGLTLVWWSWHSWWGMVVMDGCRSSSSASPHPSPLAPHSPLCLLAPFLHPLLSFEQMCSLNSVKNNKTLAVRDVHARPTVQDRWGGSIFRYMCGSAFIIIITKKQHTLVSTVNSDMLITTTAN